MRVRQIMIIVMVPQNDQRRARVCVCVLVLFMSVDIFLGMLGGSAALTKHPARQRQTK